MVGEDDPGAVGPEPYEREPDERRAGEVERRDAVGVGDPVGLVLVGRLHLPERQLHREADHLHRLCEPVMGERRAQVRVPAQQVLARLPEGVGVDRARHIEHHLRRVHVPLVEECVEQQAVLQRRQRPDVLDL
ncbi:hypothetical protein GCM10029978_003490 [Actinoallomurus acanthiterrae]